MRHSFISFFCIAAGAALLFSCAKEAGLKDADKIPAKGIKVNVIASEDISKTYVEDGEIPVVKWSASDQVVLFESMDDEIKGAVYSNAASITDGKASFSATIDWDAEGGSSYKYAAVYPGSAVATYNNSYLLYLNPEQTLNGNNLPADSDILISSVEDKGATRVASDEDIQFAFRRLGTIVRLTIYGIAPGEYINQIKMTAPANIAGTIAFDPVTGKVDPESAFSVAASNSITLSADNLPADDCNVIWFSVLAERDWGEEGDVLSFEVVTDKNIYRKEITSCPVIKFYEGGLTKFGVDLSGSDVEPLTLPYLEDFESGVDGWTFIDRDGDGHNWEDVSYYSVSGEHCILSESYSSSVGALTPDNWAFTPLVQLTEDNYLSFYVRAASDNWKAEHYAVYIAEGSPFGVPEVLMAETEYPGGDFVEFAADGMYQRFVIQIPEKYNNKAVCIGFRHFNCSDQYYLLLDDVSILEENPIKPCTAKYEDYLGEWASGAKVFTIEEKVNGLSYSISGLKGQGEAAVEALFENNLLVLYDQMLSSDGSVEIWLQGSDGYMPSYPSGDLPFIFKAEYDEEEDQLNIKSGNNLYYMVITYNEQTSQSYLYEALPSFLIHYVPDTTTYIFEDDFESDISGWTLIDADGDGNNWGQQSAKTYSGSYCLVSMSYDNNVGAYYPDNWAFTPPITLTSDNYLCFWITAQDQNYPYEHYAVYISEAEPTVDNLDNCTVLIPEREYPEGNPVAEGENGYQRHVVQIPAEFDGKTVYIGFRHFNCTDMFWLNLDDVAVSEGDPLAIIASPAPKPKKAAPKVQDFSLMKGSRPIPSRLSILDCRKTR